MPTHAEKIDALVRQLRAENGGAVRLGKDTSNLFRDRAPQAARKIDVRAFNQVLDIDSAAGLVDVEGMTSYGTLAAATQEGKVLLYDVRSGKITAATPQVDTPLGARLSSDGRLIFDFISM